MCDLRRIAQIIGALPRETAGSFQEVPLNSRITPWVFNKRSNLTFICVRSLHLLRPTTTTQQHGDAAEGRTAVVLVLHATARCYQRLHCRLCGCSQPRHASLQLLQEHVSSRNHFPSSLSRNHRVGGIKDPRNCIGIGIEGLSLGLFTWLASSRAGGGPRTVYARREAAVIQFGIYELQAVSRRAIYRYRR